MLFQSMPTNELPTIFLGKKKGSTDPCQLEMCFKEIGKAKKPEPKMVIAGKITKPSYL